MTETTSKGKKDVWLMILFMIIIAATPFIAGAVRGIVEDKLFLGYRETPLHMAQGLFIKYDNVNPRGAEPESALANIALGSTVVNYCIGLAALVTNIPVHVMYMVGQILATLFLMAGCYIFYKTIGAKHAEQAMIMLLLLPGIGFIVGLLVPSMDGLSYWASPFFPQCIYYPLVIGLGLMALSCLIKDKPVSAALLLALGIVIHPQLSIINLGVAFLYLIIERKSIWTYCIVGCSLAAVVVPLLVFQNSITYGVQELTTIKTTIIYLLLQMLSFGPLLVLGALGVWARWKDTKKGTIPLDFITAWTILLLLVGLSPETKWAIMKAEYFLLVLPIPLSLLASEGVSFLANKIRIGRAALITAAILLCLPSTYSLFVMNDGTNLIDNATQEAFSSLQERPMGMVLLPMDQIIIGPLLTHKREIVLPESYQLFQEYDLLISTEDPVVAEEILRRYGAEYVISPRPLVAMEDVSLMFSNEKWFVYSIKKS